MSILSTKDEIHINILYSELRATQNRVAELEEHVDILTTGGLRRIKFWLWGWSFRKADKSPIRRPWYRLFHDPQWKGDYR